MSECDEVEEGDGDGEGEDDDDDSAESMMRAASTFSPDASLGHGAAPSTTTVYDSGGGQSDFGMGDYEPVNSSPLPLEKPSQPAASFHPLMPAPNESDEPLRSAVDSWVLEHQLSVHSQANHAAAATTASLEAPFRADVPTWSRSLGDQTESDCYVAILAQTTRLEQALAQTTVAPPIDLVLEAERDFCALRRRLFACTGHEYRPSANPELLDPHLPSSSSSNSDINMNNALRSREQSCRSSQRPVYLGLALLAERVVGMLEDMFRLAAQSAHNMDRANELVWLGASPGPGQPAGPSARRMQRSFRSMLASPCVSPVVEANRSLRLDGFVVQGQAKSEALRRILRLRVGRMLSGLLALVEARRARRGGGPQLGGPLDWGGSGALLGSMADPLVNDLIRRVESMQGAMSLL
ncbi:Uu.00g005010.m01.CDS01 [Anthostomella pinea]|uniref:Uu.00g005010.m01.CDS01 n=1 Tax=Anthostomella pinea TaxID=933095 RepID=A0AAI8VL07_9PEZI|nr:Uu.00g005010.m01.CDS01 [Anthostomella pinea]